jgi:hypothetical protein
MPCSSNAPIAISKYPYCHKQNDFIYIDGKKYVPDENGRMGLKEVK